MQLKQYQRECLGTLRRFLEEARISGPKTAFEKMLVEPEHKARMGRYADKYDPLSGLPGVPHVCLRMPTGGGKTLLAAHSIGIARSAWIEKEFPLVLWLVPSKTIQTQTADALKNPRHPYRMAIDATFEGRVRVFDIADFTQIRPHDLSQNLCVVVGTIQSLRVSNTEGRKVYSHNEELESHFTRIPTAEGMELAESGPNKGKAKFSFANLLHHHRPLMIVDEAHNAVTGLTQEMQVRVNPSAIIEFTATPRPHNNTLFNVPAMELKNEEMIKLPIHLTEHDSWQNAVNGAIASRAALDEKAQTDSSYIRPIVLFQAQQKGQEVTVEVLRQHLVDVERIPENRIAVATGDQRELDGIDLFDPACPIEYVITMEALKEGWDCSFAYVFCSVANIRSATDVEQLLGRVLRMPYAQKRVADELNKAYAHVSEVSFQQAAVALVDKLIAMGFEEDEAKDSIENEQGDLGFDEELFGCSRQETPKLTQSITATPEVVEKLRQEGAQVTETAEGEYEVTVAGAVSDTVIETVTQSLPEGERKTFTEKVEKHRTDVEATLSPSQKGEKFIVPRLMARIQEELVFGETDVFMEFHDWSILNHSHKLNDSEFSIRETARDFEIDLNGNRLTYHLAGEEEQLSLDIPVEGWTENNLVLWLDRQVRQPDIGQGELVKWLRDLVAHLTGPRKIHVSALMRCKFILARKIRELISKYRQGAREAVYQQTLFAPEAKVELSFENGFEFKDGMFAGQRRYRGRYQFQKHFLPFVPAFDGNEDGEEYQCATFIDGLSEVRHWVRNVARHPNAFWLPTSTGRFYPDFIAELTDGRILVVEYKGAHILDGAETREKETVGRLWKVNSDGKGLFLLAVKEDQSGKGVKEQLSSAIALNN